MASNAKPCPIQSLRVQGIYTSKSDHLINPDHFYFVTDNFGDLKQIYSPLKYLIEIYVKEII